MSELGFREARVNGPPIRMAEEPRVSPIAKPREIACFPAHSSIKNRINEEEGKHDFYDKSLNRRNTFS